jgi:hypothetical protein
MKIYFKGFDHMHPSEFDSMLLNCELPDRFLSLVKKGLALYFRNILPIAAITLIAFIPVELIVSYVIYYLGKQNDHIFVRRTANIVYLIVGSFVSPAVCYVIFHSLAKSSVSVFQALKYGLSRYFSVLAATFASNLIIGVGLFLFIIPGIIFYTWYALVTPAASFNEGLTTGSLGRSKELTKGARADFFLLGCIMLLVGVVIVGLTTLFTLSISLLGVGDVWWSDAVNSILADLVLSMFPAILTVFYLKRVRINDEIIALASKPS